MTNDEIKLNILNILSKKSHSVLDLHEFLVIVISRQSFILEATNHTININKCIKLEKLISQLYLQNGSDSKNSLPFIEGSKILRQVKEYFFTQENA